MAFFSLLSAGMGFGPALAAAFPAFAAFRAAMQPFAGAFLALSQVFPLDSLLSLIELLFS